MKNPPATTRVRPLLLVLLLWAGAGVSAAQTAPVDPEVIGIEEVVRGQRGYGLSVFAGSEPERFEVEVIGVMQNVYPGMSFILARLSGQDLERSGVVRGMSGSPVYIEGRLAGAVAFSWDFAKDAIAGITPIADMHALQDLPAGGTRSRPASELGSPRSLIQLAKPMADSARAEEELRAHLEVLGQGTASAMTGASSALAFVSSGFEPRSQSLLRLVLGEVASAGTTVDTLEPHEIGPGASVAGVLIGGDLKLAASGTLTDRSGDQVVAFGHPVLSLGPVKIPMAVAEVLTVVASDLSSFKLTNVGAVVGAFDEDRLPGMRGRLGAIAPTTPVRISVTGAAGVLAKEPGQRAYHLEVADVPLMRPALLAVATLQTVDAFSYASGDQSLDLAATFRFAGYDDVVVRQSFDGSGAAISAALYLLQLVGFFELNPWVDVETSGVDIELAQGPEIRTLSLLGAHAERRAVRAGDTVDVLLDLRSHRGQRTQRRVPVLVPADAAPGPLYLFVGDGSSVDAAALQIEPFEPKSFEESLRLLGSFHSRDSLGVLSVRPARGLVVDGRALPDLPDSMRSLWQGRGALATKPLALSIVSREFVASDLPLEGLERVDLEVLPAVGMR
ncbi:MAG TPA: SpoIVB peptidase S55 domain-containing protein [Thermoanaerobaculia bacterium]|nr:SpoIVB peptidase S55 domain-containing protein [Thermoanaerobaculia bacterium]